MIYGEALTCVIPVCLIKFSNSLLVNTDPLSETIMSGKPWVEKINLNFSIVTAEVAAVTGWTSSHLECESVNTKKYLPKHGPA